MRLPWVSRELYQRAEDEAEMWRQEYHTLQQRYFDAVGATVPGITEPSPLVELPAWVSNSHIGPLPGVVTKPEPSLVAQTIKEEADGDPKLARWLRKRASELRRDGKSDGDIVSELQKWETTEPEMGVLG